MALADELSLNESVKFFDPLSLDAIARVVADADLGVPNRMTLTDARFSWNLCCRRWNLPMQTSLVNSYATCHPLIDGADCSH